MINVNKADYDTLYSRLVSSRASLALVGLGYVGMPIAIAFAKKGLRVIGFDTNTEKIELYPLPKVKNR